MQTPQFHPVQAWPALAAASRMHTTPPPTPIRTPAWHPPVQAAAVQENGLWAQVSEQRWHTPEGAKAVLASLALHAEQLAAMQLQVRQGSTPVLCYSITETWCGCMVASVRQMHCRTGWKDQRSPFLISQQP